MDYVKLGLEVIAGLSQVFLDIAASLKNMETTLRAKVEAMKPSQPPDKP